MSKPAALVATALALPLVVFGCGGGGEWHPVAGPTVIPAMPAPERAPAHRMPKKMAKHHDDDAPSPPPPAASSAAPVASASASAKPAASAPKAPHHAPKKK